MDPMAKKCLRRLNNLLDALESLRKVATDNEPNTRVAAEANAVEVVKQVRRAMNCGSALEPARLVHRPKKVKFGAAKEYSYSDIAIKIGIDVYCSITAAIDDPDKEFFEFPGILENPAKVQEEWPKLRKKIRRDLEEYDLEVLKRLISKEHRAAKPLTPTKPFVYTKDRDRTGSESSALTDACLFVPGEPDKPFLTKIGGLPYRAAEVPWPLSGDKVPMTFVAQFCFADSHDLVGDLPGDVLLIFAEDDQFCYPSPYGDEGRIAFEWYPLGLTNLMTSENVPATKWKLSPCYTQAQRISEEEQPFEGTKIGGIPWWIQHPHDSKGRFLCALRSPEFAADHKPDKARNYTLHFGDAGIVTFFLLDNGYIEWTLDSY